MLSVPNTVPRNRTAARLVPAALMLLVAAAGCTPPEARWSPAEAPKTSTVALVRLRHAVRFPAGSAALSADEARRLAEFLQRLAPGYGDRLTLAAAPDGALAGRRLAMLEAVLDRAGLAPLLAPPVPSTAPATGLVVVTLSRHLVTPPACPDWRKPEGDDDTNTPGSNFGCATATNLDLMVADPGELLHGAPTAPGDGEFAARGIDAYRSGEIAKSIKPELPKLYSGAGGGGQP